MDQLADYEKDTNSPEYRYGYMMGLPGTRVGSREYPIWISDSAAIQAYIPYCHPSVNVRVYRVKFHPRDFYRDVSIGRDFVTCYGLAEQVSEAEVSRARDVYGVEE